MAGGSWAAGSAGAVLGVSSRWHSHWTLSSVLCRRASAFSIGDDVQPVRLSGYARWLL